MQAAVLPACRPLQSSQAQKTSHQGAERQQLRILAPRLRPCLARAGGSVGGAGAGDADAGASFVQQFKSLSAEILSKAEPVNMGSSTGCCGGSAEAKGDSSTGGGCGCSGDSSTGGGSAQQAASAVMQQLNSMMGGMEGSLSREDIRSAFEASMPQGPPQGSESGERFVDVAALLRGGGDGGQGDDEDAELDALVV